MYMGQRNSKINLGGKEFAMLNGLINRGEEKEKRERKLNATQKNPVNNHMNHEIQ